MANNNLEAAGRLYEQAQDGNKISDELNGMSPQDRLQTVRTMQQLDQAIHNDTAGKHLPTLAITFTNDGQDVADIKLSKQTSMLNPSTWGNTDVYDQKNQPTQADAIKNGYEGLKKLTGN